MKAATRAEKIRRKRGRPKMDSAVREPSGRVSRSGITHPAADVVAISARVRHTGLAHDQARDQKAATYIGCLNLIGKRDGLSDDQYDAAVQYLNLRRAYHRAIGAPGRETDGGAPIARDDLITDAYEDWVQDTKESYAACRLAIQEAQNINRSENLWAALDLVIIQDQRLPHMIGATRILCNALAKFFRI